jgi:aspartate 1-decarboxylase
VQPGDRIIVITYADYDEAELEDYTPRVVHVDGTNRIIDEFEAVTIAAEESPVRFRA